MVGAITFITYHESGGELTAQSVFTVLTLFSIIQFSLTKVSCCLLSMSSYCPCINSFFNLRILFVVWALACAVLSSGWYSNFPPILAIFTLHVLIFPLFLLSVCHLLFSSVQFQTQAYVAVQRTQSLLLLEEISDGVGGNSNGQAMEGPNGTPTNDSSDIVISMKSFDASWEVEPSGGHLEKDVSDRRDSDGDVELGANMAPKSSRSLVLSNINLDIRRGELLVVVGPVGASKTSLLMAMMGELAPLDDKHSSFRRLGSLAYCSQEPWIMSTTVSSIPPVLY